MSKFAGGKSCNSAFQIEPLEQRRLLSSVGGLDGTVDAQYFNASAESDVLGDINQDNVANALDFNTLASEYGTMLSQPITTLSTKIIKLEGQFSGHYTSTTTGTHQLNFSITHCTHTGHFTGTVKFTNPEGKFPANVTGVIRSNRHLDINYSGTGFSGSMTGIASHTGGSFSGDYVNSTGPASHGTYHVAKA